MNAYLADRLAQDHTDTLLADAATARLARQARKERRAATRSAARQRSGKAHRATARPAATAAHFVARPFVAVGAWIAAGQL